MKLGLCLLTGLASIITVAARITYKPISGVHANREAFYKHEASIAEKENNSVKFWGEGNVRIGHFDGHWHGITVEEYLRLADATKSDVLAARGVPERNGRSEVVRARIASSGFHQSSIVKEPSATITSGLLIGVRNGVSIKSSIPLDVEGRTAAIEVVLAIPSTNSIQEVTMIFLTLDAFDTELRQRQLSFVRERALVFEKQDKRFMISGGFFADVLASSSHGMKAINNPEGLVSNGFSTLGRPSPSYTSWLGFFSDTVLVSQSLRPVLRDINVWHTNLADCLPILVDFSLSLLMEKPTNSRFSIKNIRRFSLPKWNWKVIGMGVGSTLVIILIILVFVKIRRVKQSNTKRIQATAIFSDSDLKMSNRKAAAASKAHDEYPEEKPTN